MNLPVFNTLIYNQLISLVKKTSERYGKYNAFSVFEESKLTTA